MNPKKLVLVFFVSNFFTVLHWYAATAFVQADLNFVHWSQEDRGTMMILTPLMAALITLIYYANVDEPK